MGAVEKMKDTPALEDLTLDRNLALEAVRVTEAAALAASRWMGRGDEKAADQAAVEVSAARPVRQDGVGSRSPNRRDVRFDLLSALADDHHQHPRATPPPRRRS